MQMNKFLSQQDITLDTIEKPFEISMNADFIKIINFLLKLSGHQHYLYALIKPEGWLFLGSDQPSLHPSLFETQINRYHYYEGISDDQSLVVPLIHYLQTTYDIQLVGLSLTSIKMIHQQQQFVVALYSEVNHQPDQATWQMMEAYIEHAESYLQLKSKEEKNRLLIQDLRDENTNHMKYLSFISHDLKAPFHGILGCLDILVHERETLTKPGEADRLLHYVHDASQSTYNLLENLLGWSMVQNGRLQYKPMHFNLSDVVQMVFDLLNLSAYYKNIKFKLDLDVELYAYADMNMVSSILQNLLSNALKFTPKNSNQPILLTAEKQNDQIKICIVDQGVGMNKWQLENIFSEEVTLTSAGTSGEKGTGLGLILCKRFAEMNYGSIVVQSELGKGTEFILYLPMGDKNE